MMAQRTINLDQKTMALSFTWVRIPVVVRPYFFVTAILFYSCSNDSVEPVDCDLSDLAIVADGQNPTSCTALDGSITGTASGGDEPYKFALNTGAFGASPVFNNLGGGDYLVRVRDKNGCERSFQVNLQIPGLDALTALANGQADTQCVGGNGSVTVEASGGTAPYQYKIGTGAFGDEPTFTGLNPGNYTIEVKDASDCTFTKSVVVSRGDSQTSLDNDIKPIIESNCAITNCHNGSEPPNLTIESNIITHAQTIKQLTQSGSMPREGSLTAAEKALIACWVDDGAKSN
jgi:hypothetical protein